MPVPIRALLGVLCLVTGLAHVAAAQGKIGIENVISWLPLDTETLIVAHGPFDIADTSDDVPIRLALGLGKMAATGPLPANKFNRILQQLREARVSFAVEGARRFRAPQELGLAPYEGCHVTVFEKSDVPKIDAFLRDLQSTSEGSTKIGGVTAIRLRWRAEKDDWSAFVVRPQPNVIVVSTSESMLEDVLARTKGAVVGRALPSSLQEWSNVDTTARVWAIRHYARADNDADPTSPLTSQERAANVPDSLAIGITISIASDTGGVVANYLSRNPQADQIVRQFWMSNGLQPSIVAGPRGVRIIVSSASPEMRAMLAFVMFGVLGHAVYV